MDKIISPAEAAAHIKDEHTVAVGGFGLVGCPLTLVEALADHPVSGLTIISNNVGEPGGKGLGKILLQNKIQKAIGSYFTSNVDAVRYVKDGKLEVELVPQGTLGERLRAAGAGIGAFYTKTSAGTLLAENKESRIINDIEYVLEYPLFADVALIKAKKADMLGNLVYSKTARNFNPDMAAAAKITIVEVEEIVDAGELDPEQIITPHLYIDFIVERKG
ncbi:3-oxoacid CoA-transferase subunit A [Bacillus pakistanensis]|uniref:3-oxoacid CoA-transferase subunit A n=1 Tax=Rossellomorea pakistanensis TaxID=992288 RepID=A0ABS2NE50_9BACI|nr:CoA transferase subunit A [Bacillus pakistanensis]MBM7586104.1 3-oxoacid CoA-transferase subunit A [Bacillus pakistanensis]